MRGWIAGQRCWASTTGIPLTERTQGYNLVPPDTITLYQGPIEQVVKMHLQPDEAYADRLRDEIRHTVIHEIAHHFGISDERWWNWAPTRPSPGAAM